MTTFPSAVASSPLAASAADEAALSREVYELALALAVRGGDWRGFERAAGALAPLYAARGEETAPAAAARALATGLQLMHLLVGARLGDFHVVVEALSAAERAAPPVAYALRLEALLMGGAYNQVRGGGGGEHCAALPRPRARLTAALPPSPPRRLRSPLLPRRRRSFRPSSQSCRTLCATTSPTARARRTRRSRCPPRSLC